MSVEKRTARFGWCLEDGYSTDCVRCPGEITGWTCNHSCHSDADVVVYEKKPTKRKKKVEDDD